MLYLVTGTPGTGKTSLVVTKLDKVESQNKVNLVKNKAIYQHNKKIIEKNNLHDDFLFYEFETGSGHKLQQHIEVLGDDYFDMFEQDYDDLRPDDYFLRVVRFNEILTRIIDRDDIKGFKALLPVRTIYTNIASLKIDYVRALEYDWRDTPDGSIHVIDEVQLVEPYSDTKSKPSLIQDLTIHRHRGFDFYFLTQAPSLLHPTVKELIGCHWHLTKPYGLKTMVYQFGSCRPYPNTLSNKLNAETRFSFSPPLRIFKLYKSTSINTHTKRFPMSPILKYGLLLFGAGFMVYKGLSGSSSAKVDNKTVSAVVSATAVTSAPAPTSAVSATAVTSAPASTFAPTSMIVQDNYQQKMQSVPANFISFGAKCTAYNRDGLPLDMPNKECKRYASGAKKVAIQIVSTRQDFTPSTPVPVAVSTTPVASFAPAVTSPKQSGKEYVFNADTSHDYLFKN